MINTDIKLIHTNNHLKLSEVNSVASFDFFTNIANFLSSIVEFDSIVILGYQINKPPIYLYDTVNRRKELLFQRYLTSSLVYDPFYHQVIKDGVEGIFNVDDVLSDKQECYDYRNQFYYETERNDELAITVRVDDTRLLAFFLGRCSLLNPFTEEQKQFIFRQYNDIKEQCHAQCPTDNWFPIDERECKKSNSIHLALSTFSVDLLTPRERDIIILMVQGLANNDIATSLGISVATVKVHRKSIYNKLNVTNLNEFWQLFLNHLMACI